MTQTRRENGGATVAVATKLMRIDPLKLGCFGYRISHRFAVSHRRQPSFNGFFVAAVFRCSSGLQRHQTGRRPKSQKRRRVGHVRPSTGISATSNTIGAWSGAKTSEMDTLATHWPSGGERWPCCQDDERGWIANGLRSNQNMALCGRVSLRSKRFAMPKKLRRM